MIFINIMNPCHTPEGCGFGYISVNSIILANFAMGECGELDGTTTIPVAKGQIINFVVDQSRLNRPATFSRTNRYKNYFIPYKE